MKTATLVSNLGAIRQAAILYQNRYDFFPENVKRLDLDTDLLKDPFSNDRLLWRPRMKTYNLDTVLALQPHPFKTKLWPLGCEKQYALFSNGEIVKIDPQSD